MERDYWYTVARSHTQLEAASEVGKLAAERALRRLGARKIPTQNATVVFEPRTARSLLGHIFDAINGDSVYRHASFLAGKLGEKVAAETVTLIDDGTLPGLFGTSPFDDEGVPSRRTVVIERGVLQSYLLNAYTARKLGLKTTGNAARGITGNASVGHGNLYLKPGARTPADILGRIQKGRGYLREYARPVSYRVPWPTLAFPVMPRATSRRLQAELLAVYAFNR